MIYSYLEASPASTFSFTVSGHTTRRCCALGSKIHWCLALAQVGEAAGALFSLPALPQLVGVERVPSAVSPADKSGPTKPSTRFLDANLDVDPGLRQSRQIQACGDACSSPAHQRRLVSSSIWCACAVCAVHYCVYEGRNQIVGSKGKETLVNMLVSGREHGATARALSAAKWQNGKMAKAR